MLSFFKKPPFSLFISFLSSVPSSPSLFLCLSLCLLSSFPPFLTLSLSCLSLSLYSSIPFFHSFCCFHILLFYLSLVRAHIVRTKKFSELLKTWQKLRTRLLKQILKSVAEPVFGFIFSSNGKKPQVN